GTVHFTSSDLSAGVLLPSDYTFTFADSGIHTFSATLDRAGPQTLTALSTILPQVAGTGSISVTPAAASQLQLRAIDLDSDPVKIGAPTHFAIDAPGSSQAGTPFSLRVTALDQFNNIVTGYTGTVHLTTTDPAAGIFLPSKPFLPTDYTFTAADAGVHTFINNA